MRGLRPGSVSACRLGDTWGGRQTLRCRVVSTLVADADLRDVRSSFCSSGDPALSLLVVNTAAFHTLNLPLETCDGVRHSL